MPSTALVFTLPSHRSHLIACLDVPPSPAPPSTSPTPQLDLFDFPHPPPHSSAPFHRFVSHLFPFPDVPPFSSPMPSTSLVFTLPSLHFPPLHFPGCPPIFIAYALRLTRPHPSATSFPSLRLPSPPPSSCAAFHQSIPSVGSFSSPTSSASIVFTLPSLRFPPLRLPGCPPIFIAYVLRHTCLHPSVPSSPPSLHLPGCPAPPSTTPTSRLDHFMPISSIALVFSLPSLRFPPLRLSRCPPFSRTAFYHSDP